MNALQKYLKTAAIAIAIASVSGFAAAAERGITDTSIKIGNIGPFSGKAAMFNPLNYGSVAYMRYVNDMGGVFGRKKTVPPHPVALSSHLFLSPGTTTRP